MATNHLIIGLGGTGGKILREYRKRYFEEFKDFDSHSNVHIEYLYVDSNEADLNDKKDWSVMGTNATLSPAQKVSIHGVNSGALDNLSQYPQLGCFLTNSEVSLMRSELGKLITDGIGGQRRRLGRTLFASQINNPDGFTARLESAVRRLKSESKEASVHFHICSGLAGGTGSGSIIDTIAQIRKHFPSYENASTNYHLHLYLYVPEISVANTSHNNGFYQANGYASLLELNALSVDNYAPVDVTGEKDPLTGEPCRINSPRPFEAAYLFSNTNEQGRILDLGYGIPKMVADFLFLKTVITDSIGGNSGLARVETLENDGGNPEKDSVGNANRSRKFISFGINRIIYPETEIKEYVAYQYAKRAIRQMTYNSWQEGIGFIELSSSEIGLGFEARIKSKEERERLKLSNTLLMLSRAISEDDSTRKWKEIGETWKSRSAIFASRIKAECDKREWIGEYVKEMDAYFDSGYRTSGVKRFYENHRKEMPKYASYIRRHISSLLFKDWENGVMSILEVKEYLRLLLEDCQEREKEFSRQSAKAEMRLKEIGEATRKIEFDWAKIGALGSLFGKKENTFDEYANTKRETYICQTEMAAFSYAKQLISYIQSELASLIGEVDDFTRLLTDIGDEVNKQADSRCRKDIVTVGEELQKYYNRDIVIEMAETTTRDEAMQRANATAIRSKLVEMLGGNDVCSFADIKARIGQDATQNVILEVCLRSSEAAMDNIAIENSAKRMSGVNILEKLRQEYNSDEKLIEFVTEVSRGAHTYLQYDSLERQQISNGGRVTEMAKLQLWLPLWEEDKSDFRSKIIKAFEQTVVNFNPSEDVFINPNISEMVIVNVRAGFPLRYVQNVRYLKNEYDKLVLNDPTGINRLVLHTETFRTPLPPLYERGVKELKYNMRPTVLLAYAMGIISEGRDPVTEKKISILEIYDEEIDDTNQEIIDATDILSAIETLSKTPKLASSIEGEVNRKLSKEYVSNSQKEILRKAVNTVLNESILQLCGGNKLSEQYKQFAVIRKQLFENELKLL